MFMCVSKREERGSLMARVSTGQEKWGVCIKVNAQWRTLKHLFCTHDGCLCALCVCV